MPPDADERTTAILERLGEALLRESFAHGTLIVIEDFETDRYDAYFSVDDPKNRKNYLYNYIRYYTAHGDVRRIHEGQGFSPAKEEDGRGPRALATSRSTSLLGREPPARRGARTRSAGVPLLPWPEEKAESPAVVHELRNGRFHARHATTFRHAIGTTA